MQKAFFGAAVALPHLAAAGLATFEDDDFSSLVMAQVDEAFTLADPSFFGQIDAEAEPEQALFWDTYLAQVDAVLAEEANAPYWTDGYTSLSQAEVDALTGADTRVKQWGKKGGMAQIDSKVDAKDLGGFFKGLGTAIIDTTGDIVKTTTDLTGTVASLALDPLRMVGVPLPTEAEVKNFLDINTKVKELSLNMKKNGYNPIAIMGDFIKQKVPKDPSQLLKMLQDVPGLKKIPVLGMVSKMKAGIENGAKIIQGFTAKDDGTIKTCWMRSKLRSFTFMKEAACKKEGREPGMAGACYQKCEAGKGKGVGPVCWGACNPEKHITCGPLCLLKTEATKCTQVVKAVTKDALSTGVHAAAGNYIGAIFGGLSLLSSLIHPICKNFNTA